MTVEERLFVVREVVQPNGDTTWTPIDILTAFHDQTYYVFNTFTGQHERYEKLVDAKKRYKDLHEQITATLKFTMDNNSEKQSHKD